jgi:hypothetical protein
MGLQALGLRFRDKHLPGGRPGDEVKERLTPLRIKLIEKVIEQ